jgi:hypothetical protein
MIDLGRFESCMCKANNSPVQMCAGALVMREKGKSVQLAPKKGEEAIAVILDKCIVKKRTTCDGLFLLKTPNKKWLIPVELKGTHIYEAFHQLATTIKELPEFSEIFNIFRNNEPTKIFVHAVVVSNTMVNTWEQRKLEQTHGIRVKKILTSAATKPIEDIRKYL